jgi:hypothetical protein
MQFTDVLFSAADRLRSYRFHLTVASDSSAHRDIAELSGYLDPSREVPGRSCAVVAKGNEWR